MFMEPTLDGTQYFLHCDLFSATMAVSLLLDFLCNSNLYNLIIDVPVAAGGGGRGKGARARGGVSMASSWN